MHDNLGVGGRAGVGGRWQATHGGGIYLDKKAIFTAIDSTISGNSAQVIAGWPGEREGRARSILQAQSVGYNCFCDVSLRITVFVACLLVQEEGGGIYMWVIAKASIVNSTLSGNRVKASAGGHIATQRQLAFDCNQGYSAETLCLECRVCSLCSVATQLAPCIAMCLILPGDVQGSGGGIYMAAGSRLDADAVRFLNNNAQGNGGAAIFNVGGNANIHSSRFFHQQVIPTVDLLEGKRAGLGDGKAMRERERGRDRVHAYTALLQGSNAFQNQGGSTTIANTTFKKNKVSRRCIGT